MSVTILVADDNPEFLHVVRSLLEAQEPPFVVHTVDTGERALAFLEHRPPYADSPRPTFMVLDYRLPDMRATSILGYMRAQPDLRALPVLVLSQAGWAEDAAAARDAGATAFRVKPSRARELLHFIKEFWSTHVGADDPAD
jgi:CheY-like chemotaxis protein